MNDALNKSKRLHGQVISMEDEEKQVKRSEKATWLVILMDEAVQQFKFQHGTVNGTVVFTEDEEMQVEKQEIN